MKLSKNERKDLVKHANEVLETDFDTIVLITDRGATFGGTKTEFLTLLSIFVQQLSKKGVPQRLIKSAVMLGFDDEEMKELVDTEETEVSEKNDVSELVEEIMENLKK